MGLVIPGFSVAPESVEADPSPVEEEEEEEEEEETEEEEDEEEEEEEQVPQHWPSAGGRTGTPGGQTIKQPISTKRQFSPSQ